MRSKIILDLAQRLPGPLATHTLARMGYKIIKVEWENFRDPFALSTDSNDQTFQSWYSKLQSPKTVKVFSHEQNDDMEQWRQLVSECSGIILSWPSQLKKLSKLDLFLKDHRGPLAFLEITSSRPTHDLNILAETGTLNAHIFQHRDKIRIPPPFLPVAGICFGQNLALQLLDLLVQAVEQNLTVHKTISLQESTEWFSNIFASTTGPHNGLYPCYQIYKTKTPNSFLVLALMEDKYWMRFVEVMKLPLLSQDRFSQEEKVFKILENCIGAITAAEASSLSHTLDCLSFVSLDN